MRYRVIAKRQRPKENERSCQSVRMRAPSMNNADNCEGLGVERITDCNQTKILRIRSHVSEEPSYNSNKHVE